MPRKTKQQLSHWVADFETTTLVEDCRVWLWGMCDIDDTRTFRHGNDLASFVFELCTLSNAHVYFHNLAFDGVFILDYLFRNGYRHTREKALASGHFTTCISNMGKFYSIVVQWKTGARTEFRDSLKKLPLSVSEISRSFKLPLVKGVIDYHKSRPKGYQPTVEEISYVRNDVMIVAEALHEQFDNGMTKLTVGSDAMAEYKRGNKAFDVTFPVLSPEIDADVRHAYRGGFTYVAERFQGRLLNRQGMVFDVNSLYPSVMYDRVLPWGHPVWCDVLPEPTEDFPLFIVSITFTAKLKKKHVPCIQIKGSPFFVATQYQSNITEPITAFCSNVDLALWQDHYDMDILAFNGGYKFRGMSGLFCDYIDKWNAVKVSSDGGKRFIAKLHLNSLYGKFATNPDVTQKVPVFNDDVVGLVMGEEEMREPVYTPMGVFITSYARDVTIRAAQQNYDTFAYADTDSLHLLCEKIPDSLNVDAHQMGAWKRELVFDAAYYARAKCYTERDTEGAYHTHIAGLPVAAAETVRFGHYTSGHTFDGKLTPVRVPGGVVLKDVGFSLTG